MAISCAVIITALLCLMITGYACCKPSIPPDGQAYFGADPNMGNAVSDISAFETLIGRKLAAHRAFLGNGWNKTILPDSRMLDDQKNGRIPMISWKPGHSWKAVAAGVVDPWLNASAYSLKKWGYPMWITFHHEPEDDVNATLGRSTADYVAMWRHVHDVFTKAGATNVAWNWIMMSWSWAASAPASRRQMALELYPGDDVVDWVSIDSYNWIATCPVSSWKTWSDLSNIVAPFYAWAAPKGKPMAIPEYGCLDNPANTTWKGDWFRHIAPQFAAKYPLFKAFVYFNVNTTVGCHNWDVRSSAASLSGYKEHAHHPYMQYFHSSGTPTATPTTKPPTTPPVTTTSKPPTTPPVTTTSKPPTTPPATTTSKPPTTPPLTTTTKPPTTPPVTTTTKPPTTAPPTTAPPTTKPSSGGKPSIPPNGQAYLGADPKSGNSLGDIGAFETLIGRKAAAHRTFLGGSDWNKVVLPESRMLDDQKNGRIPMVSWKPGHSWKAVAGGAVDPWLNATAHSLKAWGYPLWLTFHHEPEDNVDNTTGHSTADYVAMWRHIHDIFTKAGATNVAWNWIMMSWSWSPNSGAYRHQIALELYPGDDVVDWVSIDAYNWIANCPVTSWKSWSDLSEVVAPFYAWAAPKGKPMAIPEYGCLDNLANTTWKADWFRHIAPDFSAKYPLFKAFVYFNVNTSSACHNWDIRSSPASLAGYKEHAHHPYMQYFHSNSATTAPPTTKPPTTPPTTQPPTTAPTTKPPTTAPPTTVSTKPSTTAPAAGMGTGVYMGSFSSETYKTTFGSYAHYETIYYQADRVTTPNVANHQAQMDKGISPVLTLGWKNGPFTRAQIAAWDASVQAYVQKFVAGLKTLSDYAKAKGNGVRVYFSDEHEAVVKINQKKYTFAGYNGTMPTIQQSAAAWNKVMSYVAANAPAVVRVYWYGSSATGESTFASLLTPSLIQMATFDPYRWAWNAHNATAAQLWGTKISSLKSQSWMRNADGTLKPWGLSEWGTDATHGDANNAQFVTSTIAYLKSQGASILVYFDRVDGTNNFVFTDGTQPKTLAAYKAAVGTTAVVKAETGGNSSHAGLAGWTVALIVVGAAALVAVAVIVVVVLVVRQQQKKKAAEISSGYRLADEQ